MVTKTQVTHMKSRRTPLINGGIGNYLGVCSSGRILLRTLSLDESLFRFLASLNEYWVTENLPFILAQVKHNFLPPVVWYSALVVL
jgi:hypothetical protein